MPERPLRVGFLSSHNPRDPNALSGMPHSTFTALEKQGVDLVEMSARDLYVPPAHSKSSWRNHPALRGIKTAWRNSRTNIKRAMARPWAHGHILRDAEQLSARAQRMVDEADVDILFGLCISTMLYRLETPLPLVYASDTTARLINTTYPEFVRSPKKYQETCDEIEGTALRKCSMFVPSSKATGDSAINHYGVDPARVRVVELGAHVVPDGMPLDRTPPSKDGIELVLVAADPRRKRLDLCIEVAEMLRTRGWNATLNYVGPYNKRAEASEAVKWWGRLQLSDPKDRETHKGILNRSHWMLLPSLAEAFGIAPCESAHFGRPSVVTDVGGLPTVIQHGVTGMVVSADAQATAYADAIEECSTDPEKYSAMSNAALERAQNVLSWAAWASRVKAILQEVYEENNKCPQPK